MKIIGPDALVFGVDDVQACTQYLTDYGLKPVGVDANGGRFEALDGTAVVIRRKDDPSLPAAFETANMLRETVYGVQDAATLDAIAAELLKDREVTRKDGVVRAFDDMGFALAFQVTVRRPLQLAGEKVNWKFNPEKGIAYPDKIVHNDILIGTCARCHARASRLTDYYFHGQPFLQTHIPSTINIESYYVDGQIKQ